MSLILIIVFTVSPIFFADGLKIVNPILVDQLGTGS